MKAKQKKTLLGGAVVALCVSVAFGAALGCSPAPTKTAGTGDDASAAATQEASTETASYDGGNLDKWAEQFPLQYNSYHVDEMKADGRYHGHYTLKGKLLAPVVRDNEDGEGLLTFQEDGTAVKNGDGMYQISGFHYDEASHQWVIDEDELGQVKAKTFKMGCYACQTSTFNDQLEKRGGEIFNQQVDQEFIDAMDAQVWACNLCHTGTPGSTPDSTTIFFNKIGRDSFDTFSNVERACGQCHNSFDHRHAVTSTEDLDRFSAYRYGIDADSLIKAAVEDGITVMDEEIGVDLVCFGHDDVEVSHTSPMAELGVTCVTCHMPQMTDEETGQTYTSHNASGSPLANPAALEKCLECHKNQGIETADEMVKMVRDKQAEASAVWDGLREKLLGVHDLLAAKTAAGVSDDELAEVREKYRTADGYLQHIGRYNNNNNGSATKIAHNTPLFYDLAGKIDVLCDEMTEALS